MKKKFCIFLVIASPSKNYNLLKKILMKFMNSNPNFETLFIYGKVNKKDIVTSKYDLYFDNIKECLRPGIFQKSIEAIKYVNLNYDYKYIIRTNLSTFWRLDKLYNYLFKLPRKKFCGGYIDPRKNIRFHITGTGILLSKDICLLLSYFIKKELLYLDMPDDTLITQILKTKFKINNCLYRDEYFIKNNVKILINKKTKKIKTNINLNNFYFRLKTKKNRSLDHQKMFKLYNFFYKFKINN